MDIWGWFPLLISINSREVTVRYSEVIIIHPDLWYLPKLNWAFVLGHFIVNTSGLKTLNSWKYPAQSNNFKTTSHRSFALARASSPHVRIPGFGQPQQANNLVITQLGRNMQWIPSFLGPRLPRSRWGMVKLQPRKIWKHKQHIKKYQKWFDASGNMNLADPGGTLPTNHNSGWCLINIKKDKWTPQPMARARTAYEPIKSNQLP